MVAIHRIDAPRTEKRPRCPICLDTRYIDHHQACPRCCRCPICGGLLDTPYARNPCTCSEPKLSADYPDDDRSNSAWDSDEEDRLPDDDATYIPYEDECGPNPYPPNQ